MTVSPRKRRVLLAAVSAFVALGVTTGPALAGPAEPHLPISSATRAAEHPQAQALQAALLGLPDGEATSAVVRAGGRDGQWAGSAGVREVGRSGPALTQGRFRAGSVTKVVTAALVLRLAADRKVDLDRPIQRYLPGLLTSEFKPITVRQLLNHTSGIQPAVGAEIPWAERYAQRFDTIDPKAVVAAGIARGPEFAPGTQQHYLNINYTILAMLVEKVTGRSYAEGAARYVLRPAGMRNTSFPGTDPYIRGPHNRGYQLVDGERVDVTDWSVSDRLAAGDMISTLDDLERLLTSLFRGRIVPQPQLKEMFTVPKGIAGASKSAGLDRFEIHGTEAWGKTGARPGYNTAVVATRDLSRTVVYSVTGTDAHAQGLAVGMRFAFPAFR
ncbi:beta-lactamase family protein [Streptomyces sp. CWNU-1]|uniref:Beta-lactamase family protein n=1 Tax=Streptomyces albipurpureus TaxID=2897419 RepID=A0ABT0UI45_9ACTN|nr:serine hydrolase domain-containing protein [Streptomyces sp. CWNU-1]MCM2387295.1 beta-lactamase family protein [Streptomyces sp. CWNU-1]